MRMHAPVRAASSAALALATFAPAQTGVWTDLQPAASPPFRATEGLAFEPASGLVLSYGGTASSSSTTVYDETWAFNGCNWAQLFPAANPGNRYHTYLAPSPNAGRVVLFGGALLPAGVDGTTWEFDTQTVSWTDVTPFGPSPSPRQLGHLVYDSFRARTVLFGGTGAVGSPFYGDTWEWDGASWTDVTPFGGPSPPARGWHAMAYDVARQRTVLYGGYNGSQLGDTWEWDGTSWTQVFTPNSPGPRSSGAIAYDPWTQRVVLFAGSTGWPIGLDDTWEYDGTDWAPIATPGPVPLPQFLHRMVGDPVRGGVLVFGAFGNGWTNLDETWRYQRASLAGFPLNPAPGATVSLGISLPGDAGFPYAVAISLSGSCPGFPLPDGRVVPLNPDPFTSLSISGVLPTIFQGFAGTLNGAGIASAALAIPPIPGIGGTVITVIAISANGSVVRSITNAVTVVVQ